MIFYEKANQEVLVKCKAFIDSNSNTKNDYCVFKESLRLEKELIQSLLESQKDFDDTVKKELDKKPPNDESPEMDAFIFRFNNLELKRCLDVEAHKTLQKLQKIIERNTK